MRLIVATYKNVEKLDSGGVVYFNSGGYVFIAVRSKDVGVGLLKNIC